MKTITILFVLLSFVTSFAWAGNKAAVVKLIRGEAYVHSGQQKSKLKVNDWIESGATIKTSAKSFVKVVFIDKSQMNIGASSEIKVEKFHSKDAGVIDLVRGKIRSQVTKDYLQIDGKNRSKLFIKTPNAVMGIRGTDFLITTTGKNTAAILFEGSVVFNRLDDRSITDSNKLDDIVDQGVRMFPGEFSAVGGNSAPTIPALLNVQQREKLQKDKTFSNNSNSVSEKKRSIVPAGLSQSVVSSKPSIDLKAKKGDRSSSNPDSYLKDGKIKPANGSFVLIDSAQIIQPGADAVYDEATNTYIALNSYGDGNLLDINSGINQSLDSNIDLGITSPSTIGVATGPLPGGSPSDAQTVQISDSLNDTVNSAPVSGSTAGTAVQPTGDAANGTIDTETGVVNGTPYGARRLIGR